MIIITGGAGFIGSSLIWKLNLEGITDILIVDNLGKTEKWKNLVNLRYIDYIHKDDFLERIEKYSIPFKSFSFGNISHLIHLGACSDTTEHNAEYIWDNNYKYSQQLAYLAIKNRFKFIYASSASTYGNNVVFNDYEDNIKNLKPLNIYAYSKYIFDTWAKDKDFFDTEIFTGLKFFNVYGPNEYHKGKMRSMVLKSYEKIKNDKMIKLFDIKKKGKEWGKRDFVYIKDCVDVIYWFMNNTPGGLFNVGTGNPRSWENLVNLIFKYLNIEPLIEYESIPKDLIGKYQFYTRACTNKLESINAPIPSTKLEDGIYDYLKYLESEDKYLDPT